MVVLLSANQLFTFTGRVDHDFGRTRVNSHALSQAVGLDMLHTFQSTPFAHLFALVLSPEFV